MAYQDNPQDESKDVASDEFTGQPDDEAQTILLKRDLKSVIYQSDAFDKMCSTEGWKLLEGFIKQQVSWMTELLKIEKDFNKITRLQAEIIAFESLFRIIDKSFFDSDEAKKKLLEMVSGNA